jgi:hypothetical protein
MANPFDHFTVFLFGVGVHFLTLFAGCAVTAMVTLVDKFGPPWLKGKLTRKFDLAVAILFLIFACFQAWHDQYERAEKMVSTQAPGIIVNTPEPRVIYQPAPTPKTSPPRISWEVKHEPRPVAKMFDAASLVVTAHGSLRPAFKITCAAPCQINTAQYMGVGGTSQPELLSESDPNSIRLQFQIPGEMRDGSDMYLQISSNDSQDLRIKAVKLIPYQSEGNK